MFVWTDLSTFDLLEAKRFYADCFGWRYDELGEEYWIAHGGEMETIGLYSMPEKFRAIKMPSFWMSYIRVADLEAVVRAARKHGGKVEIEPQAGPDGGRIALIRDPAGAGFTCHQSSEGEADSDPPHAVLHELHVSDLSKVEGFYAGVFGWQVEPTQHANRYALVASSGETVAGVQVTPNEEKGDKEYWGVYFPVPDLNAAVKKIERAGGRILASQPRAGRDALLAEDSQGAAFYVIASDAIASAPVPSAKLPLRAWLGLLIVAMAVVFDAAWVWGLLFLVWVAPDLFRGSTHFLEHVERRRHPATYWTIVVTWLVLSLYLLVFGWS
ncbi:MAG: VOC family protein [Planctomycetota bacterium]